MRYQMVEVDVHGGGLERYQVGFDCFEISFGRIHVGSRGFVEGTLLVELRFDFDKGGVDRDHPILPDAFWDNHYYNSIN